MIPGRAGLANTVTAMPQPQHAQRDPALAEDVGPFINVDTGEVGWVTTVAAEGQAADIRGAIESEEDEKQEGGLPQDFEAMWDAHPHNYQTDESQNTSSEKLQGKIIGWRPSEFSNTCAIRLSEMWNRLGGEYKITRDKAAAAGIKSSRVFYGPKTKSYYIVSAKEMWEYVSFHFGQPHQSWPPNGTRYKTAEKFDKAFRKEIQPVVSAGKGIVAFDKIFGYSGTGHVDLFEGESLSDANEWYPSQRLMVWYI